MISRVKKLYNQYSNYLDKKECYQNAIIGDMFEGIGPIRNESGDKTRINIGHHTRINGEIICKKNGKIDIGNYSILQWKASIGCLERVKIGHFVSIAMNCVIMDNSNHNPDPINMVRHRVRVAPGGIGYPDNGNGWELSESAPIVIEDVAWIGANSVILRGVTIGEGATVARNSIVTKDVPPYTIVAGIPARVVKEHKKPNYKYYDPDTGLIER